MEGCRIQGHLYFRECQINPEELADGAVVRGVLSDFHLVLDFGRPSQGSRIL